MRPPPRKKEIQSLNFYLNTVYAVFLLIKQKNGKKLFFLLFILFFFKAFPVFRFLEFIGKFSLTILAAQLVAMTFIKLMLLLIFHQTEFQFSEWERFLYSILQIVLMIPGFFFINKYIPILNGGYKKI